MILSVGEICNACGGRLLRGDFGAFVTGVKTDSREITAGDLFVPIKGERTDAHIYISNVFAAGAVASFTENLFESASGDGALIYVENSLAALQKLAYYYRNKFDIPVVGVTGSVGKTTTKEMIALALSAGKEAYYTKGNFNSQIGLPLTIMGLEEKHDCAVIEMGMSDFGEMSRLARITRPTVAVITNIGISHIAQLKTQNNIMLEKLHITDGFASDQLLLINGDDPWLSLLSGNLPFYTVTYGLSENCRWRAINICTAAGSTSFDVLSPRGKIHVYLPALGVHNIQNALAALAVADAVGVSVFEAARKLAEYTPPAMRQQIYNVNGITIIDDSYNASPDSVKSGIDVLCAQNTFGRKIAVLADMKELGDYSEKGHTEIGLYADEKKLDAIFAVGEDVKYTLSAAKNANCRHFESNEQLAHELLSYLQNGDCVLIKGSRSMHTEEVVKELLNKL